MKRGWWQRLRACSLRAPLLAPKFSGAVELGRDGGPLQPLLGTLSEHLQALLQRPVTGPPHGWLSPWLLGWRQQPTPCSSVPARLPFTIFQGGMPRASYGDRHCISVIHNGQQTAFDFTSRVIDFTVLIEANPEAGRRAGVSVKGRPPGGVGIRPTPIHKQRGRACRRSQSCRP